MRRHSCQASRGVKVQYNGNLRVMTMGINEVYQKTELRRHNWREDWDPADYSRIEIGAGGGKQAESQLEMEWQGECRQLDV